MWACDSGEDRTHDGRGLRLPVVVDAYTRGCPAIAAARRPGADDVLPAVPAEPLVERGPPGRIRSGYTAGS
ncbi:MAG TPA: hypothetical protein VFG47_14415 [Geminicoccaceae bacterium]|nr:hypothetical protein [Geminicoccaceae bacterium]